eukprot:3225901-Rhodomonas_salina.1
MIEVFEERDKRHRERREFGERWSQEGSTCPAALTKFKSSAHDILSLLRLLHSRLMCKDCSLSDGAP